MKALHLTRSRLVLGGAVLCLFAAFLTAFTTQRATAAGAPSGLHVSGNQLLDGSGTPIVLRGVDRSGTEYQCIHDNGIFDGPSDANSIAAMAAWHINTVRVPLNEDCWLGINGAPAAYSGSTYRSAIEDYVTRLHAAGLVAILDLHWTAAGGNQSTSQQDMPDADHAPDFWTSVATAFKSDGSSVFDLFNEPHDVSWTCWRDGGDCGIGYQVAGMQTLVDAVRATGAKNPVLAGGLAYANDLSQWLRYRPTDGAGNLMASWHSYNFNSCNTISCWDAQVAPVAAQVPLVAGEVGENDCAHGYLDQVLPWLDDHGAGYVGWAWNVQNCATFPALISNYDGTPTNFGIGLRDHLASLASNPPPPPSSTSTPPTPPSSPSTSPAGGTRFTVAASADTSSAPYYWEEDLVFTPAATTTTLTVTVAVARTAGISYAGFYDTAANSAVTLKQTPGTKTFTYRATLNAGNSFAAHSSTKFGIQFNGKGSAHDISGDKYTVTATVGGRKSTKTGHF